MTDISAWSPEHMHDLLTARGLTVIADHDLYAADRIGQAPWLRRVLISTTGCVCLSSSGER
jgi:hypothetical protein